MASIKPREFGRDVTNAAVSTNNSHVSASTITAAGSSQNNSALISVYERNSQPYQSMMADNNHVGQSVTVTPAANQLVATSIASAVDKKHDIASKVNIIIKR